MEKALKREGTFCMKCHDHIHGREGIDFIAVPTKGHGITRYTCMKCAKNDTRGTHGYESYNDEVNEIVGKETKSKLQFAVEWEGNFPCLPITIEGVELNCTEQINAYMASQYQLLPTHDGTVDVEYKEYRRTSLHGYKNRIQGISEIMDLTRDNSGHHINISKTSWGYDEGYEIYDNGEELFSPLAFYLSDNYSEMQQIFGRTFSSWSKFTTTKFEHGYWLNIKRDIRNEPCLEFRLAKFHDVNQFFYLINFCKEVVELIDKWLKNIDEKLTAEKVGEQIVGIFKNYVNGKALCMRAERNNSKTRA